MRNALTLSPEIRAALADGMPVVALESTVIAHGLPHPDNLETSQAMEQAVRDAGWPLYTSDGAGDLPGVDIGGRGIIKKKKKNR